MFEVDVLRLTYPPLVKWMSRIFSCAQDQPVLLPAKTDPGDERRLGHLLALHHLEPPL